jgi:hypothetical protein
VDIQCPSHRRTLLTFCLCLSYFGVRIVINCYTLLLFLSKDVHLIGHIRPFCILATRLMLEQENVVVTFIVSPQALDKTRTEVSRQFLNGSKALKRIRYILKGCTVNRFRASVLILICFLNLKDPLAVSTQWRRNVRPSESIHRCIPCCIPDSLSSQANYMFRNGNDV